MLEGESQVTYDPLARVDPSEADGNDRASTPPSLLDPAHQSSQVNQSVVKPILSVGDVSQSITYQTDYVSQSITYQTDNEHTAPTYAICATYSLDFSISFPTVKQL